MSTIWVKDLSRGLDVRRLPESTPPGALIRGRDGHITRGGEFEKRAAFVPEYNLPAGRTMSLAATPQSLLLFGHQTPPSLGSDFVYQQLTGHGALRRIVSWDLFSGQAYVAAEFMNGDIVHYYNGVEVDRAAKAATTFFLITSGSVGVTYNVLIDGVSATGGAVAWAGSATATAQAIVNAINSTVSSPDYVAALIQPLLAFGTISAAVTGPAANSRAVSIVTTGGALSGAVLAGGIDAYVTGTRYVRTIGTKMYTLSESNIQFSAVGAPTNWSDTDTGTGFGFISTDQYTSGSEKLTAVVEYRNFAAVFAENCIQIWTVAADPADNAFQRVLRNVGTSCPRSVVQYGDGDLFFLDESGLRSLRSRDSSNAASTTGVGVKVDPLILEKLRSLTEAERENVIGLIEPQDGRFWLIVKDTIFVLSLFEEERINAWTVYTTSYVDHIGIRREFTVDDAVVFQNRVYLRSGDTVYVYGGLTTGQETDGAVAEAWTAYLDADDPAAEKQWTAIDMAFSGEWSVAVGMDLADVDVEDAVASFEGADAFTTYGRERIPLVGRSTHLSVRFRSLGDGPARVGACAVHYDAPARPAPPPPEWQDLGAVWLKT